MTRSRPITFLATAVVIPLGAVAIAAGGGGGATAAAPPTASQPPAKTLTKQSPSIRLAHISLGQILVNSSGRTLYLFKGDSGMKSACAGACATAWPPLLAIGKPTAGSGLTASKLGTITRSDGAKQVTYNGHPLYTFMEDKKPGNVNGEGVTAFGASWFAVSPAGNQISSTHRRSSASSQPTTPAAPATTTTTTTTQPAPPPAAKTTPAPSNDIPQNGGGDGDADNSGGPSDGDGNI